MARLGIVFGLLLCGLTVAGLVLSPLKSPSQFMPMMFGVPLLFCGVVALNPHRRKQSMCVALAIAVVGGVIAGARAAVMALHSAGGGETNSLTFAVVLAMSIICIVFVVLGTISLLRVRRQKDGAWSIQRSKPPSSRNEPSR